MTPGARPARLDCLQRTAAHRLDESLVWGTAAVMNVKTVFGNRFGLVAGGPFCRRLQWGIKRICEWLLAAILLCLLAPWLLLIAVLIKLDSAGPAFFLQPRLGRNGRVFRMYKFRSLRWDPDYKPVLHPDGSTRVDENDCRLTRLGRFLRIGLDELPQLWNVLKAEMALIGPRPDEPFHRQFYSETEERKLSVLPGIAGLPQALGRNDIPWKARIQLDLYYIDHYSLWLDLKIAALTLLCVGRQRGIYAKVAGDSCLSRAFPATGLAARRPQGSGSARGKA